MWAVKIYALVWFLASAIAVVTYLIGGFSNEMTQMIFGFFFSTLFSCGFIMVLPVWVNEYFAPKY